MVFMLAWTVRQYRAERSEVTEGKPYAPLGEVMDQIARQPQYSIRGPYRVADFVKEKTGKGPARNTWSDYFYGKSSPSPDTMRAFSDAFECNERQVMALAYARAFRGMAAA